MYLTKLVDIKGVTLQEIVPILLLLLITIVIVSQTQEESSVPLAEGQAQNNATTDMTNMRNAIVPQAEQVDEANSELIKICAASPNPGCDNAMIIIHNDCIAYPEYVGIHIPSCNDSRLLSYLIARGLLT
ncbi:hypothetical protein BH18THE2_BH18THE2_14860 [soil metagenome]